MLDPGSDHQQDCRVDWRVAFCRGRDDSGQAFPVYIVVIAGLLFLAFAYFAVGQAAFTRNSAQTAADAAALAAAQDARDQLREGWLEVILDPDRWDELLRGKVYDEDAACHRAADFAALNEAVLSGNLCEPLDPSGFRVTVTTTGSESRHAMASAEAVIEPLCEFRAPEPSSEPTPTPTETGDTQEEEGGPITGLVCDGDPLEIDPEDPATLPSAVDLFTVRLSE
ncbi:pilus assembly protein TadG-related protein [Streptomyces sp. NPDC002122]|uniref:pilus assembly protein TadG-related protein n=1 Tax=Streptomyces sp. NPDC002122 TaxID=3154407 RepID=UPI00333049B5